MPKSVTANKLLQPAEMVAVREQGAAAVPSSTEVAALREQRRFAQQRLRLVRAAIAEADAEHKQLQRELSLRTAGACDHEGALDKEVRLVSEERSRRQAAVREVLVGFTSAMHATGLLPPAHTLDALLSAAAALPSASQARRPEGGSSPGPEGDSSPSRRPEGGLSPGPVAPPRPAGGGGLRLRHRVPPVRVVTVT